MAVGGFALRTAPSHTQAQLLREWPRLADNVVNMLNAASDGSQHSTVELGFRRDPGEGCG
jgi:hypothetical protein